MAKNVSVNIGIYKPPSIWGRVWIIDGPFCWSAWLSSFVRPGASTSERAMASFAAKHQVQNMMQLSSFENHRVVSGSQLQSASVSLSQLESACWVSYFYQLVCCWDYCTPWWQDLFSQPSHWKFLPVQLCVSGGQKFRASISFCNLRLQVLLNISIVEIVEVHSLEQLATWQRLKKAMSCLGTWGNLLTAVFSTVFMASKHGPQLWCVRHVQEVAWEMQSAIWNAWWWPQGSGRSSWSRCCSVPACFHVDPSGLLHPIGTQRDCETAVVQPNGVDWNAIELHLEVSASKYLPVSATSYKSSSPHIYGTVVKSPISTSSVTRAINQGIGVTKAPTVVGQRHGDRLLFAVKSLSTKVPSKTGCLGAAVQVVIHWQKRDLSWTTTRGYIRIYNDIYIHMYNHTKTGDNIRDSIGDHLSR